MDTGLLLRQKAISKYKDEGFVLVKLRPQSKRPMEHNWTKLPFRSKFNTQGNYGIVLQHDQLVIDVDPRNFKNDENSFAKLKNDIKLSKTLVVRTGSGGYHFYYKKPASLVIKKLLHGYPGVEFKTKGTQVVGPGSIHPDTKEMYKPYKGSKLADMVDAPPELLNALAETHSKTHAPRHRQSKYMDDAATVTRYQHYLQGCDGAIQGEKGDEHTFVVAATGKDMGLPPDTVYEMMLDGWNSKCDPPWGLKQLKEKVKNAYSYGSNEPGSLSYRNIFGTNTNNKIPEMVMNKDGQLVNSFINACYFLRSKQICYIGAGQKKTAPHDNPLGELIRYNELRNKIEFTKPAPWHNPVDLDDVQWNIVEVCDSEIVNIKYYLDKLTGLNWSKVNVLDAVIKVSHDSKYNPVTEWIESLTWDGVKRIDTWLTYYCGVKETRYTRMVGVKTLCAAVARTYTPGIKFDHMLVLEGKQGTGKSTAVKILGGDWSIDIMLRTDNKDTVQLINSAWIIEVSEMAGLRKAEVESLKAFISRSTDSIRPPFAKTPVDFPRRSIFIGTINPSPLGYLNDETGNRRYWPVVCDKINMSQLKRDRDQLFAEATLRLKEGERLYITDVNIEREAIRIQETRNMKHPWIDIINRYFQEYDIKKTTVKDLFLDALDGDKSRMTYTNKNIILNALMIMGWKRNSSGEYINPKIQREIEDLIKEL